jgi:RNA polymerase sigma-70 factor (ECF subfamily)
VPAPDPGEVDLRCSLAAGDPAAVAALYDRFAAALFRTAWGLVGSAADAEDAVQDVFVSLVQNRRNLPAVADLRAYLFAALRYTAAKQRARRRAHQPLPDDLADRPLHLGPDEELARALGRLPEGQREVVVLKLDGELTFAELAAGLGISPNTAASRYRYALAKLRDLLKGAEP